MTRAPNVVRRAQRPREKPAACREEGELQIPPPPSEKKGKKMIIMGSDVFFASDVHSASDNPS